MVRPDPSKDVEAGACTVAVLVSSRQASIETILESIYSQAYDRRLVRIVFAENSSDGSLMLLREFQSAHREEYAGIEILEKVVGISHARNMCLERASGAFLVFVDDDVVPPADTLHRISSHFESNPACGAVGLRYVRSSGHSILERTPLLWRVGVMPGMGCTGIRADVTKGVGEFDESLTWGEDLDYICRVRRSGHTVHLLAPPHAIHLDGGHGGGQTASVKSALKRAVAPKTFDARLLLRHGRFFLPVISRKYGPFIALLVGLALIPISWVPAVVMIVVAWLALQTAYTGRERVYMPLMFLVSGIASVVGLIRGFSAARAASSS